MLRESSIHPLPQHEKNESGIMANTNPEAELAVTKLKKACDDAYDKTHDCSHSVWAVMQALIDKDEPYRVANTLIQLLTTSKSSWKEVGLDDGWELANQGVLVIGGLSANPNGHVIVIYPGDKIDSGGYLSMYAGKMQKVRSHGLYPRCMSQSKAAFPGTRSRGDKTVWDPWANDTTFADVQYWAKS
jgi:hypothetical protein